MAPAGCVCPVAQVRVTPMGWPLHPKWTKQPWPPSQAGPLWDFLSPGCLCGRSRALSFRNSGPTGPGAAEGVRGWCSLPAGASLGPSLALFCVPKATENTVMARWSGLLSPSALRGVVTGSARWLACVARLGLSLGGNKSRRTHRCCSGSRCRYISRSAAASGTLEEGSL